MKQFIYWLMGDRAGRAIVVAWNWLWGIQVESEEAQFSVDVAEASLKTMQESLKQLAEAVSTQAKVYNRARKTYQEKVVQLQKWEEEATIAQDAGDEHQARLAMTNVLQIEKILPQLEQRVRQAEEYVNASKQQLERERLKVEEYKAQMENMKALSEINEALEAVSQTNRNTDIDSARRQFEEVKSAIELRHYEAKAYAQLSENSDERLSANLDGMMTDDEVSRRLQGLKNKSDRSTSP